MAGLLASLFGGNARPLAMDEAAWQWAMGLPLFDGLTDAERGRLEGLARELMADKAFSGAGGLEVDAAMATVIAAHAALPVLELGCGPYRGWNEIVVYPGEFVPEREYTDEAGVVHHLRQPMSGEAWEGGPMVLSWQDVEWSGLGEGFNVVIHEFAHKLDMKAGGGNGRPPLPPDLDANAWAAAFNAAYEDLCRRADAEEETEIDPYATESPAEFFAVASEYFFELPQVLDDAYPAVYAQLKRFYRQDPLSRQEPA